MKDILELCRGAKLPWRSVDSFSGEMRGSVLRIGGYGGGDSQADIDRCLACEKPDCTNCIASREAAKKKRQIELGQCVMEGEW